MTHHESHAIPLTRSPARGVPPTISRTLLGIALGCVGCGDALENPDPMQSGGAPGTSYAAGGAMNGAATGGASGGGPSASGGSESGQGTGGGAGPNLDRVARPKAPPEAKRRRTPF